jgi:hypothetical protein
MGGGLVKARCHAYPAALECRIGKFGRDGRTASTRVSAARWCVRLRAHPGTCTPKAGGSVPVLTTVTQGDHERLLCSMRCLSSKCYAEVYDASPHHRISWRGVFHTPNPPFRLGGG